MIAGSKISFTILSCKVGQTDAYRACLVRQACESSSTHQPGVTAHNHHAATDSNHVWLPKCRLTQSTQSSEQAKCLFLEGTNRMAADGDHLRFDPVSIDKLSVRAAHKEGGLQGVL